LKPIVLLKRIIFAAALIPAAALALDAFRGNLTANPIEYITHTTGDWAIRFLVITLAVTPLRRITGWNPIIQLRRMLGLFSFFYATLHFLTWFVLDWFFDFRQMAEDIAMRPFITLGMATYVMLLALALTSTQKSIRRLGRKWTLLHRLISVSAGTALLHFWLGRKTVVDQFQVVLVSATLLLGFRVWWALRRTARSHTSPAMKAAKM
jgi:sulfoxide reductase heme-binding subunit YedZ